MRRPRITMKTLERLALCAHIAVEDFDVDDNPDRATREYLEDARAASEWVRRMQAWLRYRHRTREMRLTPKPDPEKWRGLIDCMNRRRLGDETQEGQV